MQLTFKSIASISEPTLCDMANDKCRNIIVGWTVGQNGECMDENYGIKIGKSGFKKVMMQVNDNLKSD